MAGQPIAGTDGRFQVGGDNLNLEKFTVTPQATEIPGFNFESGGFDEGIFGKQWIEWEVSGMYDALDPPFNVPSLKAGAILSNVKLYISKSTNKFFNMPLARVMSAPVTNEVEGKVTVTIRGKSQGAFFYPV